MSKQPTSSTSPSGSSPDGIGRFIRIKTIVGDEVQPAFGDALNIRKEVFCGEQHVSLQEEIDGLDAVSVHLIAYIDLDAQQKYHEEQKILARLTASSGVAVKFKHPSSHQVAEMKGEPPARYKPAKLEPVGTLRLRRVSTCSQLGKFNMMIGKIERLCVRSQYRRTGAGEILLQAAEKTAKDALHVPWVMVHAQMHAKRFYQHRGYVVWSEKEFMDANIAHIVMVKNLSSSKMHGESAFADGIGEDCCRAGERKGEGFSTSSSARTAPAAAVAGPRQIGHAAKL